MARGRGAAFLANVTKFVEKAKGNIDLVVRKIVFDMGTAIIMRTPVDTGRLIGNWQFTQDVIPEGELSIGSDPQGRLVGAVEGFTAGHIHYIINNLPYAAVIEYGLYPNPPKKGTGKTAGGFSIKAPAGMVRVTVVEYQKFISEAIAEVNS